MSKGFEQVDRCDYLFLAEIEELGGNGLRLLLWEGRPAGEPQDVLVGGQAIHDCTRIDVTAESVALEIVWTHYVAYSVLNESFASPSNDEEVYAGKRLRIYLKSRFRQYISQSTFATDDYPGPMQHYEVCCEDHIVNVISTASPSVNETRLENSSVLPKRFPRWINPA